MTDVSEDPKPIRQKIDPRSDSIDRPTLIVLCIKAYLLACVFGTMFLLGNGAAGGKLTPGQFAVIFFLAGPALVLAYLALQALLEGLSFKSVALVLAAVGVALLGWQLF
jgi:hypothetical protein